MEENKALIKIIGVGGGGGNAVNTMVKADIKGVSYLLINTDRDALEGSPVSKRIQIGSGLGAGNNPKVAHDAAVESSEEIKKALQDGTQMVFVTATMGGGTGTGAAPVVAKIAKEAGMLTIAIVTIPFRFEGEVKIKKALDGIEEMIPEVDSIIVINNQLLTNEKESSILDCFALADNVLMSAAKSIADIISHRGTMNVDYNDVKATLTASRMSVINFGEGEGENRVTNAINNAVHSTLVDNSNIRQATRLLFYFYTSRKNALKGGEIDEIEEFVNTMENPQDVIWGYYVDESFGDKVGVTLLAAIGEELDRSIYLNPTDKRGSFKELRNKFGEKLCSLSDLDDNDELLSNMRDIKSMDRDKLFKIK